MLVAAAMGGGSNYIELAPDGRELDASERAGAREQLRAGAIAILTTERRRDLVDQLEPNVPLPETLLLVRVLQQALILALSQDPAIRARALDARMMAHYLGLAQVLWKEHQERTGRWDD
jgi:hypothetical protein